MTQEEKQLLIQELCARSPYKVKVQIDFGEHCIKYGIERYVDDTVICVWPETFEVSVNDEDQACDIEDVKPYLRPMSNMTKEEIEELKGLTGADEVKQYGFSYSVLIGECFGMMYDDCSTIVDWLNAHHFDYRGLIPMGLALVAPEGMYDTKTE